MTQDDKKTYLWTAGVLGVIVVVVAIAFALGIIPTQP